MAGQTKQFYVFGPFRLDPEERVLLCHGEAVPLAPKVAETLLLLVQNAGRLVEKDDLMKRVWPATFVEEGNLNKNIFTLRKALSQRDGQLEYIETVPKRGYRFVESGEGGRARFTPGHGSAAWSSRCTCSACVVFFALLACPAPTKPAA